MNFKLFKKYCKKCGEEVNKESSTKKFGEHFCSEEHAEEYGKELNKQRGQGHGGCCG